MSTVARKKVTLDTIADQITGMQGKIGKIEDQLVRVQVAVVGSQQDIKELHEKVAHIEQSMVTKSDIADIMGELQASREVQEIQAHNDRITRDTIESHESRITVVEKKVGIVPTISFA